MIIFLLILCVLGFAYTNVFGRKVWHKFCMVIFGLGFLASLSLIVLNDKDHFGMTEVTQDKTFELKAVVQAKMAPTCYCTSRWAMVPKKFIYITHQIKETTKQERKTSQTRFKKMLKSHISPKRRNGPIKSLGPKHYLALLTTITNLQNKKTPSTLLVTG